MVLINYWKMARSEKPKRKYNPKGGHRKSWLEPFYTQQLNHEKGKIDAHKDITLVGEPANPPRKIMEGTTRQSKNLR